MRNITSPVSGRQLSALSPDCEQVQFASPLTPAEYAAVASLLQQRPEVWLRVLLNEATDLDFLRYFPNLQRFKNHAFEASTLDALSHVPRLTHLDVDAKRDRFDLGPLLQLPALESVKFEKCKATVVLAQLPALRDVTLVGCDLGKHRATWAAAEKVLLVQSKGTLPELPVVRELSISATTGPELSSLSECVTMRGLGLYTVRNVTSLPDISRLTELRRLVIYRAPQLTDVSALAALPNLRELELREVPLTASDVAFLSEMPGLERCRLELSSANETRAAIEALPIAAGD